MKYKINQSELDIVNLNNETIPQLQKENQIFLNNFLDIILLKSSEIFKTFSEKKINEKILVTLKELKKSELPFQYIENNFSSIFFVGEKSIYEIGFNDTLNVTREVELVAVSETQYVIEVTFQSERKNLREEKIKKNKFRFVYSTFSGKVTCKRLTS